MIEEKAVEHIKQYGTCQGTGEQKKKVLDDIGFPVGRKADYIIIAGCFQPIGMPHVLKALKHILEHYSVSYTLLEKEYCCGWMTIGQPAVMAKNEVDIAGFRDISRDFIVENFNQAKQLGAKTIVLFCGACEPSYTNYAHLTDLEVISCSELIDRYFQGGKLDAEIDYYAGCYRFRRKITEKPVDLKSAPRVLKKIEDLKVNNLENKYCCYIPPHLDELAGTIKSDTVVSICTGCYYNTKARLEKTGSKKARMLPEIVWESIQKS